MCRHDKDGDGKLTFKEIWSATETNANWMDAVMKDRASKIWHALSIFTR
jgi:hypothetical protein